jgi:N-formylglutamate amidohydrolase
MMAQIDAANAVTSPFIRIGAAGCASPVVLSVPHAGREYSEHILKASRLSKRQLETLEDRYVDRLIEGALRTGATAIVARCPRAEIDLNRDEREIDPAIVVPPPPMDTLMPSARTRGGLGLVPARISGAGAIWRQRLECAEVDRRIAEVHRPYHAALAAALEEARARFGIAILLDCHSMPSRGSIGAGQAEVVFGDLHGTTIAPDLLDTALQIARQCGFRIACNVPYAGGYITARHGRPAEGIHAMQIEIDRSLYLAPDMRNPGRGFDRTLALLANITSALADRATGATTAIAAE